MAAIRLIRHAPGAPGLRWFGLGPGLLPTRGLLKLQRLFNKHAFWASDRTIAQLRRLLSGSTVVITLWRNKRMIGFGRATSDGICRAVLWDVVVAGDLQGCGLGRQVVEALLNAPSISSVERVYLMTTISTDFYQKLGFEQTKNQKLLFLEHVLSSPLNP
ncbi:acetyltransferase [Prochlorococcus marinus str. MIT 1342]|uniref:GNAT family N-acetyltransferase n=1 Tax=Prochlorococcus TaxID=1218 RepID=UPI0007B3206F|nr:GNAT family N-acetyltransferase [Prochlorococcus marinus]KZR79905.1 acetyltransferase [Prochlorococcus marinus str. MIT 1342]